MNDRLNNCDLKEVYSLIILTGREKLLSFFERKEPLTYNWADENGQEYQLERVFFKDKEITLKCAFLTHNNELFWKKYHAFFNEISKPGFQTLFIDDHDKNYEFFYKSTNNFKHGLKRLKNVYKVFVEFDLHLLVRYHAI